MSVFKPPRLTQRLSRLGVSTGGRFALSFKDLQTGEALFTGHGGIFPSASLIKLGILFATVALADQGRLSMGDRVRVEPHTSAMAAQRQQKGSGVVARFCVSHHLTVAELCMLMTIISDNAAADLLVGALGRGTLNDVLAQHGFVATRLTDDFADLEALEDPGKNPTSAYETMRLLELLYRGRRPGSLWAIDILKQQHLNSRLPLFLPQGVEVAHKTGTLVHTFHDAGIVYSPVGDYVLAILTSDVPTRARGELAIAGMSRLVYRSFLGRDTSVGPPTDRAGVPEE